MHTTAPNQRKRSNILFIVNLLKTINSKNLPVPINVFLAVFSIINFFYCSAQELPKIILPSPDATSLFRYQDYPLDHSTGVTQIKIPLYELKSGNIRVPIELNYHASGRRVDDQDGPIALGWTLSSGGVISRTVKGSADFGDYRFPFPFITGNLSNQHNYIDFEQITHYDLNPSEVHPGNWKDSEYDIFSYYFNENNGKFIFKDENNVKTPVLLSSKPYAISPVYSPNGGLGGINILDDQGTFYEFLPMGYYSSSDGSVIYNDYRLSKIISTNKTDTVSFNYTLFTQVRTNISQTITAIDKVFNGDSDIIGTKSELSTNYDFYTVPRLQQINFKNGKVVFNLVSGDDKIENIQVFDKGNNLTRSIQFNRSRLDASSAGTSNNVTNTLDSIVFKDSKGISMEAYKFEYYPTIAPQGVLNLHDQDWWGYYNASMQNDLIPEYNNLEWITQGNITHEYSIGNPSVNREPNLLGLTSGILRRIIYPTGGSMEFTYQKNRYKDISTSYGKDGPGIRIWKIKTNDRNGTSSHRTFLYGEAGKDYGSLDLVPKMENMVKESSYYYFMPNEDINPLNPFGNSSYRKRVFYSDFIPYLKEIANRPVIYKKVTEYLGTQADNIGKIEYTYDYMPWTSQAFQNSRADIIRGRHVVGYNYWNTPSLINKKEFKNIANNIPYQLVKETVNNYSTTTKEKIYGLHVDRVNVFPQKYFASDPDPNYSGIYIEPWAVLRAGYPINLPYAFGEYQISVGIKQLSSSYEILYNENGSNHSINSSYTYNSQGLVSSITSNTSDGGSSSIQITYPFDYTGIPVLSQMASPSTNMLNFPIERISFKNNKIINATKINYFIWDSSDSRIYPQTLQTKKGTQPYKTRIRFHNYDDFGNVLSVSMEDGPRQNYIWSYGNQFPVAKIMNSDYNTIEAILGGTSAITTFSNSTPENSVVINNFLNPLFASPQEDLQVLSYSYKPLIGMTSETNPKGVTRYYEYDNYQRLMNVKDHFKNLISHYNYNYGGESSPAIYSNNYTSQNFIKNNCSEGSGTSVTYRVEAKKYFSSISQEDADLKALGDIQANGQNYANQNGECFFRNTLHEQTFVKQGCETGVNGSSVTYTVPAGSYLSTISQADADAKAQADILVNGQNYANTNGTCGFFNEPAYKLFTRNNCPVGQLPSEVLYTVEAKQYYSPVSQAEANALAQAEINSQGQDYANTIGTCKDPVNFSFTNSTSDSYGIVFKDEDGNTTSYTCLPGTSSIVIPQGIYSITAQNISSNINRQIYVSSRTAILGTYVQFTDVYVFNVGSPSEKTMGMLD